MANLLIETETDEVVEGRVIRVADRPIPFERFLGMAEERYVELVDGVIVEKPMVQLDHELCSAWLYAIMKGFVEERGLGRMLSSRIMVQTDTFGGRMPDLLFVRQERLHISQQRAVYGAPDLILEIVSPNDRPVTLHKLETDYHGLGVPELVFINLRKQELRFLHRQEDGYEETVITSGEVTFRAIAGLTLQAEWILKEPRPGVRETLNALLP